jgi:hypothetical protein
MSLNYVREDGTYRPLTLQTAYACHNFQHISSKVNTLELCLRCPLNSNRFFEKSIRFAFFPSNSRVFRWPRLSARQNVNFVATCNIRGDAAWVTYPKVALLMFPSTELPPKNWAWLKVLKVSKRTSRLFDSVNFVVL